MKYKRHSYNHVVERKLEQLPTVDADHLWNDMHSMLDEKMPQKKERRRIIGWLFTGKGFFLSGVALIVTLAGFSLFFLYPKENSTIAGKKPGAGKSIEDGSAIVSNDVKENITIATDTYQTQKKE